MIPMAIRIRQFKAVSEHPVGKMICELCGIKTQINWGDGETVLCEPCSNSDQGKEIRIRRQNSIAKTIEVSVIDPNEYGASLQDKSYFGVNPFGWTVTGLKLECPRGG